jgi:hypothetical protein
VVVVGGRAAVLSSLRSLRVVLPSGEAYWTVVDEEYRVVAAADAFLRDLRFGADRTESTTKLYAGELALFLGWAAGSGRELERAARELSRFVLLLRTTPITRRGRGYGRPRSAGRINHVLAVVREFVKHQVALKGAKTWFRHAAARWYSWRRPPSRSRRWIAACGGGVGGWVASGGCRPSARCGRSVL